MNQSVSGFLWDEDNEQHLLERHPDISAREVDSILDDPKLVVLANTQGRSGVLLIGKSVRGRLLVVVARPTPYSEIWRPTTAHQANSAWQRRVYEEA